MLSAIGNDGKRYISGAISNPKSRDYTCPRPECGKAVSHVSAHDRSLTIRVCEHFRHPADASHPIKHFTWQVGNIVQALQDAFNGLNGYELIPDRFFTDRKGNEHYAEMSIKDKVLNKEAVVRIESEQFNANGFKDMLRHLSSQGLYTLLLLSAKSYSNPSGKYFRNYANPRHPDRTGLRRISGNELAIYNKLRELQYYDHERFEFFSSKFRNFVDDKEYDYTTGEWVAGETEYETLKKPVETMRAKRFVPIFWKSGDGGIRVVRLNPIDDSKVPMLNKMYELRQAIDAKDAHKVIEHSEELSIMQQDAQDDDLFVKIHSNLMDKAWNEIPEVR
jgi:hypothetical protein